MNTSLRALRSAVVAAALTLVAAAAYADVPGRVGRIAFMQGDVQAYSESEPEWKAAYINQPLTSRNSVFVGDSGRVEISVGSTTLAMDAGSQVDIQQLDDNTFDANVVRGHVSLQVRRLESGDAYNVASPDATFALLQPGRYRIDALEDSSGITVFSGQASVQGERGSTVVNGGGALRIAGNDDFQPVAVASLPLDNWVSEREARFRNSQTERYVSPNMTGYEELEANGRWSSEPDVGPVWYPTTYVQQGWAPYRYGRWAYVAPWGYTWVDDAPWGFAPFHYGRWIEVGGRWGWTPGAYVARPVYAPALVGFYGGSGFNASFSVGSGPAVGWYPLAPWQRYSPHYTQNSAYISRVNNITIVNAPQRFGGGNGGRDWNRERGATIAPQDAFASQRSISRVAIAAPRGMFDRASSFNPADLPRPSSVPGAVRRGPDFGGGSGRPDFRSPRDFATRGNQERPASFPQQGDGRGGDRGLPSNYQRQRDDPRQQANEPGQAQPDRRFPTQRGPNEPGFERGARPVQPAVITGDGQGGGQRFVPRTQVPSTPNAPAALRGDGVQLPQPTHQDRGDRGGDRGGDRQFRENRNMQSPPPGTERQQVFERPQRQQQAPAAMPAPVAPVPQQQRAPIEAPRAIPQQQPQQQRPQERPQQEQRAPQPPRGGPERPPTNDNPFAQPRG